MKIIHCADLHLDSKMESNLSYDQARERREELLDTFRRMVEYAVTGRVSVIIIAGDLFDRAQIRKSAGRSVMDQITEHPEIDFIYLKGNHDSADLLEDAKEEDMPKNLKCFTADEWTYYTYEDEGQNIVIAGRELKSQNASLISNDLVLDPAAVNIVTLHGQEAKYEGKDNTEIIRREDFKGKNIDYLALGHIHRYICESLDERGTLCYSGCLEGRGFDECGRKGFVLLDVSDKKVSHVFVPFARRTMHEIQLTVNQEMTMGDVMNECDVALRGISAEDMVKLVLNGYSNIDLDLGRVRQTYRDRFYFLKVTDETSVYIDYDSFKNDRSLKGEFVRLLEDEELPEEIKNDIVEVGIRAILGEDIFE